LSDRHEDTLAGLHSITSAASASSFAGTFCVRPSRMKVFVANTWTADRAMETA
jgi:hypothetical protein